MSPARVAALVLAAGASTRFGSPKQLLRLSGRPLLERTLDIMCDARAKLGIGVSSSLNLFIADGTQLAAVRYCFDFGCYPTEDAARLHEVDLGYLSLWYTAGRDYGLHDGEWKMTGGSENATSILIASEPLTRDTAAWVEVPEYSMLHAALRKERPAVTLRDLR